MTTSRIKLVFLFLLVLFPAKPVEARIFNVNSGFDVNDLTPGDELCVAYLIINPPYVFPFCTIRGAVEEANALPGRDLIKLGSGTFRLSLEGTDEDKAGTGDLDITDSLEIIGAGVDKTFIDASELDRVFDIIGAQTSVTLSQLTIRNGYLSSGKNGGGGIRNGGKLSLKSVVISGNSVQDTATGDSGGGILNNGSCSLINCTITDNKAREGGGVMNTSNNFLYITASTITTNISQRGAGIMNEGSTTLINSTFSGNRAQDGVSAGGAIYNDLQLELVYCTIANNSASVGGGLHNSSGSAIMTNTLLAGNAGGNCSSAANIISSGNSLDSDNSCGLSDSDLIEIDPKLTLLRDNGGSTFTHQLNPGSPAIDAALCLSDITIDQRGENRPQRRSCDIGAVEVGKISVVPFLVPLLF